MTDDGALQGTGTTTEPSECSELKACSSGDSYVEPSDVIDYTSFTPIAQEDQETVLAAHELYAKLIGLWTPAIIEAAFDLGIFPYLQDEAVSSDQVAHCLSVNRTAARILLDGLHACGIIDRSLSDDGIVLYRLHDRFAPLLLGYGSYHLVGKLSYDRTVAWSAWRGLADTIRYGASSPDAVSSQNKNSEQEYAELVKGINFWAPHVVETLRMGLRDDLGWDLSRPTSMLDVGCGSGIYSHLLLRNEPSWDATGLETPKVSDIAQSQAERFGVADRFECYHADLLRDEWGSQRDLILVANVFHLLSSSIAYELVERAAATLRPGGCLCVVDHIVDGPHGTFDDPQDRFAALFAVSMLSTGGGDAHRVTDYDGWLDKAGLRRVALKSTPMHRLLLAVAPTQS